MRFIIFDLNKVLASRLLKLFFASVVLTLCSSATYATRVSPMFDTIAAEVTFISKPNCKQVVKDGALAGLYALGFGIAATYCWKKATRAHNELTRGNESNILYSQSMAKNRFEFWSGMFSMFSLGTGACGILSLVLFCRACRVALGKR